MMNAKDKTKDGLPKESLLEILRKYSLDEILPFLNRLDDLPRNIDFSDPLDGFDDDGQNGQDRER
jgi:hypothetical protein